MRLARPKRSGGGGGGGSTSLRTFKITSAGGSEPPYVYSAVEVAHDGTEYFQPIEDHWLEPDGAILISGELFNLAELGDGNAGVRKLAAPAIVTAWRCGDYWLCEQSAYRGTYPE